MSDESAVPRVLTPGIEIAQIEQEISDLQADLSMIASQLANHDRLNSDGERLDWREYNQWRHRALYARGKKEQQVRELRIRRKALLKEGQRLVLDSGDTIPGHLARVVAILVHRAMRHDLTKDEMAVLESARAALTRAYGDNALGGAIR